MRCPSCSKFATYGLDSEPEFSLTLETTREGSDADTPKPNTAHAALSGDVRIVLTAECCGDELKETTFDVNESDIELIKHDDCTCEGDAWWEDAEIGDESGTITNRREMTNAKGKPIAARCARTYYGIDGDVEINCACGKTIGTLHVEDETQASSMEELG